MKKPNPKDYSSKDHLRGKYSDDLEKYISYLETEVRHAVANYMKSEGCTCCQDVEAHEEHTKRLAELLNVPYFQDESVSEYKFKDFQTY